MRPEASLLLLEKRALSRLVAFRGLAVVTPGMTWREVDSRMASATIQGLNPWHQYCRSFYLSCALGAKDGRGNRIPQRFPNEPAAIGFACTVVPKKDLFMKEPRWRNPAVWHAVVAALGAPVVPDVLRAAGLPTDVFAHLPAFRNFYAHRCRSTALTAKSLSATYLLLGLGHPTDILTSRRSGSTQIIMADWFDDMSAAVGMSVST